MRRIVLAVALLAACGVGAEVGTSPCGADPSRMGNLPVARNTTYGGASPVKSVDLDDIQDCIIGGKHPEQEHVIVGAGWLGGTATWNGAIWSSAGGGSSLYAALPFLRTGERITQVKFRYGRQNAGNVIYQLVEVDISNGVVSVIATATDNASGMGDVLKTLAAINLVIAAGKGYALNVQFDAGAGAAGAYLRLGSAFADCL